MKRRIPFETLVRRLQEPRRFIQVLAGPRQVGKTTLARQAVEALDLPAHYATADQPTLRHGAWLEQEWDLARLKARASAAGALLVLDEAQKVPGWSEAVKRLWDEDTRDGCALRVLLLGSSPLLMQSGLSESLAGRFETIPLPHWSFAEMQEAFGWSLDQFLYYGAYPGAAPLAEDPDRWRRYIVDSLIETTLSRDILLLTRIEKPALLRRLFLLGCEYSGQVLSYTKMLGQLQDVGNTVTLAHYLGLLQGAGLVAGLSKFSCGPVRQRGSSPKLLVLNTALMTAQSGHSFDEVRRDGQAWGRLVESAVGAHLFNTAMGTGVEVTYWRERNHEVDFVLRRGRIVVGIEVKSGRRPTALPGMSAFMREFRPRRVLLAGGTGTPIEEFLSRPAGHWLQD